jgi:hypothetical protein
MSDGGKGSARRPTDEQKFGDNYDAIFGRAQRAREAAKRDFPEDAWHENGQYQNLCCMCQEVFIGYKRRVVCKLCSAETPV